VTNKRGGSFLDLNLLRLSPDLNFLRRDLIEITVSNFLPNTKVTRGTKPQCRGKRKLILVDALATRIIYTGLMRRIAEPRIRYINRVLRRVASRQSAGCNRVRDTLSTARIRRGCSSVTRRNPPASLVYRPERSRGSEPAMIAEDRCKCVCEICEAPMAF